MNPLFILNPLFQLKLIEFCTAGHEMSESSEEKKIIPGSDIDCEDIFKFPYLIDIETVEFLQNHSRIMFIVRGFPGTGKNSLADMLQRRYPSSVMLSADNYFTDTFNNVKRDFNSLKQSHAYCHKKVKYACKKNSPVIIVKNTHVRKKEMQEYLDYASVHNYIVIMAATIKKFQISAKNLAASNTKGLSEEYFVSRLRQWEEIVPILTGWFLSPQDSDFLRGRLAAALDALLGDGRFCRILNIFDQEKLFRHYKARKLLYCVAACCKNNAVHSLFNHYTSEAVGDHLGRCFPLVLEGYLVTPSHVMGIVELDSRMRQLRYFKPSSPPSSGGLDELTRAFRRTSLSDNFERYSVADQQLDMEYEGSPQTGIQISRGHPDTIDTKSCSVMHLADAATHEPHLLQSDLFFRLLSVAADMTGRIALDRFQELQDGFKVCRLQSDAWLVKPPYKYSFKSVFTGLYV